MVLRTRRKLFVEFEFHGATQTSRPNSCCRTGVSGISAPNIEAACFAPIPKPATMRSKSALPTECCGARNEHRAATDARSLHLRAAVGAAF